jgi:hypothetical protein
MKILQILKDIFYWLIHTRGQITENNLHVPILFYLHPGVDLINKKNPPKRIYFI